MADEYWSGGCQCGAVRYALTMRPRNPLICHCRMCQKHMGNIFGAFADVAASAFKFTRGEAAYFRSSDMGERGFCKECGTPLLYRYSDAGVIAITIGSLDRHSEVKPQLQYGIESQEPWFAELMNLPGVASGAGDSADLITPEQLASIGQSNRQHPDHDTEFWPPRAEDKVSRR